MLDQPVTLPPVDPDRAFVSKAIETLAQEAARSADTQLLRLDLPSFPGIPIYFKDEAAHPTGSLKHRLARSLFLYALCNGRLRAGQTVVDASSGSTAISEAWFARLLGLPFIAVMPACTAPGKLRDVESLGGKCDLVDDPAQVHARAAWHAAQGACHLDQFGLAERATDWRGNNNIAESILAQMARRARSRACLDRLRSGHRRNLGHHRAVSALQDTGHPPLRGRAGGQRLCPRVGAS